MGSTQVKKKVVHTVNKVGRAVKAFSTAQHKQKGVTRKDSLTLPHVNHPRGGGGGGKGAHGGSKKTKWKRRGSGSGSKHNATSGRHSPTSVMISDGDRSSSGDGSFHRSLHVADNSDDSGGHGRQSQSRGRSAASQRSARSARSGASPTSSAPALYLGPSISLGLVSTCDAVVKPSRGPKQLFKADGTPIPNKTKRKPGAYEKEVFLNCEEPCTELLRIELVGDAKQFRLDGRFIRDVVGCAAIDISKLTDLDIKVPQPLYKPIHSAMLRSDEHAFSEPSNEKVGMLHMRLKRAVQETKLIGKKGKNGVQQVHEAEVWQTDIDLYLYDEANMQLKMLVASTGKSFSPERLGATFGTKDHMFDDEGELYEHEAMWETIDWLGLGMVAVHSIDKYIKVKFPIMQNIDTLILAYGMMNARHDGVPVLSTRRTWVERDGFLPLLCAQLIFKRFWSIFERIATDINPFAYTFKVMVDVRELAFIVKRSGCKGVGLQEADIPALFARCSPDEHGKIMLARACRIVTMKTFFPAIDTENCRKAATTTTKQANQRGGRVQQRYGRLGNGNINTPSPQQSFRGKSVKKRFR